MKTINTKIAAVLVSIVIDMTKIILIINFFNWMYTPQYL